MAYRIKMNSFPLVEPFHLETTAVSTNTSYKALKNHQMKEILNKDTLMTWLADVHNQDKTKTPLKFPLKNNP